MPEPVINGTHSPVLAKQTPNAYRLVVHLPLRKNPIFGIIFNSFIVIVNHDCNITHPSFGAFHQGISLLFIVFYYVMILEPSSRLISQVSVGKIPADTLPSALSNNAFHCEVSDFFRYITLRYFLLSDYFLTLKREIT